LDLKRQMPIWMRMLSPLPTLAAVSPAIVLIPPSFGVTIVTSRVMEIATSKDVIKIVEHALHVLIRRNGGRRQVGAN